jgi:hypothetical protein
MRQALADLVPLGLPYALFRLGYVLAGLVGIALLWRRPRPTTALLLVLGLHLAAWTAYVTPLGRVYALDEHLDRSFQVGMTACTAAGASPFEHTQVRFGALEPFWNLVPAALGLFQPERARAAWHWLPVLALVFVALAIHAGLRTDGGVEDAWERVLVVFAALGLSSLSMSPRAPVPPFWTANFMLKPNHAAGWGLLVFVVGWQAGRRRSILGLGLLLGFLAWFFLIAWAYAVAGLFLALLLTPRVGRDWRRLGLAVAVSGLIAAPYARFLARDYSPLGAGGSPEQIWRDAMGVRLAVPHWGTLDLGPLLVLGLLGILALARRGGPRDRALLGLLATAWGLWLAYELGALFRFAPEPDEAHYFLRFTMAIAAGAALAAAARHVAASRGLQPGQGHLLAMACCLPLTFPAYWDPPTMDRYFKPSLPPVPPKAEAYGAWVREHTAPGAVFAAGSSASSWIPALAGRRVLLAAEARPPADYAQRKQAERTLLLSGDGAQVLEAARAYGVTHLAVDRPMREEYGDDAIARLAALPVYKKMYASSAVLNLEVRPREGSAP